jgi:hypothetical protein
MDHVLTVLKSGFRSCLFTEYVCIYRWVRWRVLATLYIHTGSVNGPARTLSILGPMGDRFFYTLMKFVTTQQENFNCILYSVALYCILCVVCHGMPIVQTIILQIEPN